MLLQHNIFKIKIVNFVFSHNLYVFALIDAQKAARETFEIQHLDIHRLGPEEYDFVIFRPIKNVPWNRRIVSLVLWVCDFEQFPVRFRVCQV